MIEEFRHGRLTNFAGRPVIYFNHVDGDEIAPGDLPADIEAWAWRVGTDDWDDADRGYGDIFPLFTELVDTRRVQAFIVGNWITDTDMERPAGDFTALLIEEADDFPALESLFVGDIEAEQHEVSWIHQSDPGPLLAAFPRLHEFGLRGGTDLSLQPFRHEHLEELTFQAGGLPPQVVQALGACELPSLTGLDLYLGSRWYSGGATGADLEGMLSGRAFPRLRHLGLRNAENADEIAAAVADAPIVARLESLDLSLGNLSDEGAAALLAGQPLTHLKSLDLHHHYLSDAMIARLWEALPGVRVNVDEQQITETEVDGDWNGDENEIRFNRYIAVSE
jgi:hypothetical protein